MSDPTPAPAEATPPVETAPQTGTPAETAGQTEAQPAAANALMELFRKNSAAFCLSAGLHLVVLMPLAFVKLYANLPQLQLALETFIEKERTPEEFTRELSLDTTISETQNFVAGAPVVSSAASGGSGSPAVAQQKIEQSEQFKEADVAVNVGNVDLPGLSDIGTDLGESVVAGEVSAPVEGYGAAMSRVAQELSRLMRENKVLVVWLFDESGSMKDDQEEIKKQFRKIYEELGIIREQDQKLKKEGEDILLTAVHSYGEKITQLTEKPTNDDKEISKAIDRIKEDVSGKENMCEALESVIEKYRSIATRGKRRLVICLVTDESGDDGVKIDNTILVAKRARAPIFVLGRESVFGYPIARMRYRDPQYQLDHWLAINRGPETAYYEALQYDGLHERWDTHPSGFGPYEQARLAKETGGIFFILPHEEQNLVGQAAVDKRKFDFLDMKEYVPELVPRRTYQETREKSKFRETIFQVAKGLDPQSKPTLNIAEHWYPAEHAAFQKVGQENFNRALVNLNLLSTAIKTLEAVRPLRAKETSQRWRANYDLALAQCKAYRVRLFQFCLVMDKQLKAKPPVSDPKHNAWNLVRTKNIVEPTPEQVKITKVDFEELKKNDKEAREEFEFVIKTHPRTPWSNRAEYELNTGFSWVWQSIFRDPRYDNTNFNLPKL